MRYTKCSVLSRQLKYIQELESVAFFNTTEEKRIKRNVNVKSIGNVSKAGQSVLKYWIISSVLIFQEKKRYFYN